MKTSKIARQDVAIHHYNTVIVGAGAAGMNCAVHLYEFMKGKGVKDPQKRIAVLTGGIKLGASRMSGSDKQTYYKQGTSPEIPDCAEEFAKTLLAGGCCHGDLALAEGISSLREFSHLVQAGVPFPTDAMGTFIGYKTDHDPAERATSAGPKTSRFMSECLQRQVEGYGIRIFNKKEVAHLLAVGSGKTKRIAGVVTLRKSKVTQSQWGLSVFLAENVVLAAGGPGALYKTSVYPEGQIGIHGLAFRAGLAAENATESQFGLASTKFRWNVSGTYMQAVPRIFSTDASGKDEREFLTDFFPSMSKMATDIFLKGYQWPFDPQRIENLQSSLIDVLVFNETQKGRRVFMDFRKNPIGNASMKPFDVKDLEPEAYDYLDKAGAFQATPIKRLAHMNPLAIDIYKENGINLYKEPLEIAVCAQHNNGGFAVNKWWESNVPHTFVIGEMAGSHGVKRPGGSALNAGQAGGLRAAEYIANVYGADVPTYAGQRKEIDRQIGELTEKLNGWKASSGATPNAVIDEIQNRMTTSGGHIRELADARKAVKDALNLYTQIEQKGLQLKNPKSVVAAIQAEHLALASVGYLKAIAELLKQGSGSRGSHLVLAEDGVEIHEDVINQATGKPLKFKPENTELRSSILRIELDPKARDLFKCTKAAPRPMPKDRKAFEPAWQDYRDGKIYQRKV
ncbi:MAG: FAD-binding protein [Sedimentisphaerales bacterium]|nr:FAD-binding protein [Sedimentisphaerales bacterium]